MSRKNYWKDEHDATSCSINMENGVSCRFLLPSSTYPTLLLTFS